MISTNEQTFLGFPISFADKVKIYPPLVKDVAAAPEKFAQYHRVLTLSQEEIEDLILEDDLEDFSNIAAAERKKAPTPLELLMANAYHNEEIKKITKEAFYFFTREDVTFIFVAKKILIGDLESAIKGAKKMEDLFFLDESNFFEFQNKIRQALGDPLVEPPDPNLNPGIRRMRALARQRDRVKAERGNGLNFMTTIASICCMGLGITPLNIGEMSYAAIPVLFSYYQEKERYDLDIKSLLAGADSKKVKPKYWIRNLNVDEKKQGINKELKI